jgi:hypothetical protein
MTKTLRAALATLAAVGACTSAFAQTPVNAFAHYVTTFDSPFYTENFSGTTFEGTRWEVQGLRLHEEDVDITPHTGRRCGISSNITRIEFSRLQRRFGGWFRAERLEYVPYMYMRFYRNGVQVGSTQMAMLAGSTWLWRGYDCNAIGGFDEVRMFGHTADGSGLGIDTISSIDMPD